MNKPKHWVTAGIAGIALLVGVTGSAIAVGVVTMAVAFLAEVFILPATIKLVPGLFSADALRRTGPKRVAA